MAKLGDVLKAKGHPSVRLVGVSEGQWVAEPLEFGPVLRLDAATLRDDYKVDDPTPPPVHDDAAMAAVRRQRDADANAATFQAMMNGMAQRDGVRSDVADARMAAVQRGRPAWTPDEVIAAQSSEPSAAEKVAAEIAADERRLKDVAAGHVSVHPAVLLHLRRMVAEKVDGQPL